MKADVRTGRLKDIYHWDDPSEEPKEFMEFFEVIGLGNNEVTEYYTQSSRSLDLKTQLSNKGWELITAGYEHMQCAVFKDGIPMGSFFEDTDTNEAGYYLVADDSYHHSEYASKCAWHWLGLVIHWVPSWRSPKSKYRH